jgi:hypothetical protein
LSRRQVSTIERIAATRADSDLASYTAHPIDTIEPLPEVQSDYRTAAKTHMATLKAIDFWMSNASNPRLA